MFCTKCGEKIDENSKFCDKCGAKVGGNKINNKVKKLVDKVSMKKKALCCDWGYFCCNCFSCSAYCYFIRR